MLKQTILSKAQETQKRNSLGSGVPDKQAFSDQELEAALLSLEQSSLTQNLMQEFINARNEGIPS